MAWIFNLSKYPHNVLVMCKSKTLSFHVIGYALARNVGGWKSIRVGEDPWIGSGYVHSFTFSMVMQHYFGGLYTLNEFFDHSVDAIVGQG